MRRLFLLGAIVALALFAACSDDDPTRPPPLTETSEAIVDAVNGEGGNPFVFLKPPVVDDPDPALFGIFNPDLEAVVEICAATDFVIDASTNEGGCPDGTRLVSNGGEEALYTVDGGPRGRSVAVDAGEEEYQVNISFRLFELADNTEYRIVARVGPKVLTFTDLEVVSRREMRSRNTGESLLFTNDNRTLPFKFRVDEGALCWEPGQTRAETLCSSGTVDAGEETSITLTTSDDEEVVFYFPTGWEGTVQGEPGVQDDITLTIEEVPTQQVDGEESCFLNYDLNDPDFGNPARCFKVRADTDDQTDVTVDFTGSLPILAFCPDPEVVAQINGGQDNWLMTSVEVDAQNQTPRVYPNVAPPPGFPGCSASSVVSAETPVGRFAQSLWQRVRPAVSPLLPQPLHAADLGFGGEIIRLSTIFFWSRFPESIEISAPSTSVGEDDDLQLTVSEVYHHGASGGETVEVDWSSSDQNVATVDANGLVTGVEPGTATITATTTNVLGFDGQAMEATFDVTTVLAQNLQVILELEGNRVPGAQVSLVGTTFAALTDANGEATLAVPPGSYTLTASVLGSSVQPRPVTAPATGVAQEIVLAYNPQAPTFCWTSTFGAGWNDACYRLVNTQLTWTGANTAANASIFDGRSGHLVTITSQEESDFIQRALGVEQGLATWRPWIGLTDAANEGVFTWVTGETFDFTNWDLSNNVPEPSNGVGQFPDPPGEDYVEMFSSMVWNDVVDNHQQFFTEGYLVEFPAPPIIN